MLYPKIVVVGCGNPLFADDGFGPAVIEELKKYTLSDNVKIVDAGLGGPHFVFTLLDPQVTKKLVIIDCADFGAKAGSITKFRIEELPPGSYRDAHSWDLTEPLQRLKDDIDITVVGCQPKRISAPDFKIGLTDEVKKAIPEAVQMVLEELGVKYGATVNLQEKGGRAAEGTSGSSCEERSTSGETCSTAL